MQKILEKKGVRKYVWRFSPLLKGGTTFATDLISHELIHMRWSALYFNHFLKFLPLHGRATPISWNTFTTNHLLFDFHKNIPLVPIFLRTGGRKGKEEVSQPFCCWDFAGGGDCGAPTWKTASAERRLHRSHCRRLRETRRMPASAGVASAAVRAAIRRDWRRRYSASSCSRRELRPSIWSSAAAVRPRWTRCGRRACDAGRRPGRSRPGPARSAPATCWTTRAALVSRVTASAPGKDRKQKEVQQRVSRRCLMASRVVQLVAANTLGLVIDWNKMKAWSPVKLGKTWQNSCENFI